MRRHSFPGPFFPRTSPTPGGATHDCASVNPHGNNDLHKYNVNLAHGQSVINAQITPADSLVCATDARMQKFVAGFSGYSAGAIFDRGQITCERAGNPTRTLVIPRITHKEASPLVGILLTVSFLIAAFAWGAALETMWVAGQ